jgi:hypothetical protein
MGRVRALDREGLIPGAELLVAAGLIQELTPALEELRAYFDRDPALLLGVHCDRHLAGLAVGPSMATAGTSPSRRRCVARDWERTDRGARSAPGRARRPPAAASRQRAACDVEAFWRKHDYRPIPVSYFGKTMDVRPTRQADP